MTTSQIILAIAAFWLATLSIFVNAHKWYDKLLFKVLPMVLAFLIGLIAFRVIV